MAMLGGEIPRQEASGVVLVPLWPTQPWFPKLVRMLNFNSVGSTSGGFGADLQEGFKASSTQEAKHGSLSCSRELCAAKSYNVPLVLVFPRDKNTLVRYQYFLKRW